MGKKVLFLDSVEKGDGSYNMTYGTDDINAIVRSLTGAGVSIFPSGETFNVSDLNSITEAMVNEGVSFDGLKISLTEGKIHIAPGIGFFENGAIITVDADGEELGYKVSENVYVYAEYDKTLNICDFRTSEKAPTAAEGVFRLMLAVIEADGTIKDKRKFAQSKVSSIGKNEMREYVVFDNRYDTDNAVHYSGYADDYKILWEQEIDISKFNLVKIRSQLSPRTNEHTNECDIRDDTSLEDVIIANYGQDYSLRIRYEDGKIQIYITTTNGYYDMYITYLSLTIY